MAKITNSFRLPREISDYLTSVADETGKSKTDVVVELLEASMEGRLLLRPRAGTNAFPAHQVEAGTVPEYPVLIAE